MAIFLSNSPSSPRPARALVAVLALFVGILFNSPASHADETPDKMIWATYGLTSTAYVQSVILAQMLEDSLGIAVALQPKQNALARQSSLKSGQAGYCACGVTGFFAQEALSDYAQPNWGPQPLRTILMSRGSFGLGVATAKTARIRTLTDLKGRKIAWINNSDEANYGMLGALKFAGLTRDQVIWVEFPNMNEATEALLNNKIDAGFMPTTSPHARKLAASPRGIFWPSLPRTDLIAWWRLKSVAPYITAASNITGAPRPDWQGARTPFPILMTTSKQERDQVYSLTKAIIENYELFKDGAKGVEGWHIYAQDFSWVIPYHDGAIKYFRESGFWTDEHDAHNDNLILRQNVLSAAWASYLETQPEDDNFVAGWKIARSEALDLAGLQFQLN